MHHFPGSQDPTAVSANEAGVHRGAGRRTASSLVADGQMSVLSYLHYKQFSKTNTVCKFQVMSLEDDVE